MTEARFHNLVESYLSEVVTAAERRELEAAVTGDEGWKREFVAQVRLARQLGVLMRNRTPQDTWTRVERLLWLSIGPAHGARLADAVEELIDRSGTRRPRPWRWMAGGASLAVAASLALMLLRAGSPARLAQSNRAGGESVEVTPPVAVQLPPAPPRLIAPTTPPPAVAVTPPPPRSPAPVVPAAVLGDREELVASEGPELAVRPDLIFFGAFETRPTTAVWPIRDWLRQHTTDIRPGMVGNALHVGYSRGSGQQDGGTRMRVRLAQNLSAPAGRDVIHVRYYVRLDPEFEFGPGGFLPGVCGGLCAKGNGRDGVNVRAEWQHDGAIAFGVNIPMDGALKGRKRWTRSLVPGVWHSVELRVKLNTPGKLDGAVVGWLDGERAGELTRLRLRDVATLQIDSLFLDTSFRHKAMGAPRDLGASFDQVVVAGAYIGPRGEGPWSREWWSPVAPDEAPPAP